MEEDTETVAAVGPKRRGMYMRAWMIALMAVDNLQAAGPEHKRSCTIQEALPNTPRVTHFVLRLMGVKKGSMSARSPPSKDRCL